MGATLPSSLAAGAANLPAHYFEVLGRGAARVEQRLAEALPSAPLDPQQMKQVLVNLMKNAMQAMTRGTVSEAWAWTHHPAWYKEVTGRDPQQALQEARRNLSETPGNSSK